LRRRSPSNVIEELEEAKKIVDYRVVQFEDEIFSFDYEWLQEFGDMYKKKIGAPLVCYIYPNKEIRRQLELLRDIGLTTTCLALQSGSSRINREIFNRPFDKDLYLETAHILSRMNISYYVDVITYNPFEEREDLQATLDVLTRLPKPFGLCVNKLYFMKGTRIHDLVEDAEERRANGSVADRTFAHYCRLFFFVANHSEYIVGSFNRIGIFEKSPFLSLLLSTFSDLVKRVAGVARVAAARAHKALVDRSLPRPAK
jgi:radical SAM superfamily enzyme YgiQ (UPF0313 family)